MYCLSDHFLHFITVFYSIYFEVYELKDRCDFDDGDFVVFHKKFQKQSKCANKIETEFLNEKLYVETILQCKDLCFRNRKCKSYSFGPRETRNCLMFGKMVDELPTGCFSNSSDFAHEDIGPRQKAFRKVRACFKNTTNHP